MVFNKTSIIKFLAIVTFFVLIALPLIEMKFHFFVTEKNTENRNWATLPKFNIEKLDPFPKQFEAYFNDHFGLRTQLVYCYNYFRKQVLKINDAKSSVLVGKNDYLYWASEELPQHKNFKPFTKAELNKLVQGFKKRSEWLQQKGIKFYVIFPPVKARIYPEYLPFSFASFGAKPKADQLYDALKKELPTLNIVDVRNLLKVERTNCSTYPKTDNHWTDYGAFLASTELSKYIQKDFPRIKIHSINDYKITNKRLLGGNLARILNLHKQMKEDAIRLIPKFNKQWKEGEISNYKEPKEFMNLRQFETVSVNFDSTLPRAVIIRDSFAQAMMPYLNQIFSKAEYIFDEWQYKENRVIVEGEKPDVVILEVVEDKLGQLLLYE